MKPEAPRFKAAGWLLGILIASVLLCVAVGGCQSASRYGESESLAPEDTSAGKLARLDRYTRRAMKRWDVPGLAVAVVKGDSTLFAKGYGVRKVGTRDSVTASTVFGLLSPTKTMTMTALAMLAQEGKLSWDDPVVRRLPGFRLGDSLRARRLTIRDLVSHRSGYEDPYHLWYESGLSREEIVDRLSAIEPDAPLRSAFHYNNVMYIVAGEVVEAASGVTWDAFVQRRILDPLGMERSAPTPAALGEGQDVVSPHERRVFGMFGSVQPGEMTDFENVGPAGSVQTTAEDMTAWLKLHLGEDTHEGRQLLGEAAARDLRTPQVAFPDEMLGPLRRVTGGMAYGTGWFVLRYRGQQVAMHGGGGPGQRSYVGIMPGENLGVVVLSNLGETEIAQALTYYVFDLFTRAKPLDWNRVFYEEARPWWQFW